MKEEQWGWIKDWRKAELYTISVEEAAVALPWASAFYLPAVWKWSSNSWKLQHSLCLSETFPEISFILKPVVCLKRAPTQWLLLFAPRCKNPGPTERRSMKLGLKGSRLRLRMCASAGPVLASSSTPAFEDVGIANRHTPHYTYTPVAGLPFPVSFLFLLTFLLPLHHVRLCFPAQVSRLGSWIICLHLFSF